METSLVEEKQNGLAVQATTPDQLLALAVDKNLDIDKLEKLMALKERWDAQQAKKSFFNSLSAFQKACPVMKKTKEVKFNGKLQYKYAPLSEIVDTIKDILSEFGLTYRWETKDEGANLVVTCFITHLDGHSEQNTMSAAADKSGSKNDIQSRGSSISYLQRYTLIGALGISSADSDNDGDDGKPESTEELHKAFMLVYNRVIQKDSKLSKYHPDNWKRERTAENYIQAIRELNQKLSELS
jgi:hypothetical protein